MRVRVNSVLPSPESSLMPASLSESPSIPSMRSSATSNVVRVQDLRKAFDTAQGPLPILDGVSFSVPAGQRLAVTGDSGCGKSTLLHILAGLEPFDDGDVEVAGRSLAGLDDAARAKLRRAEVAVVFQQFNLIPSLTIADNVAFQARVAGKLDRDWLAALLERLGIAELRNRYPEQVSGGQQQRAAVARALAVKPTLLLADEPTGNLDETASAAVLDAMNDLVAEVGATLILVTHSDAIAEALDRRLRLSGGKVA